jgi:hypothetical protein
LAVRWHVSGCERRIEISIDEFAHKIVPKSQYKLKFAKKINLKGHSFIKLSRKKKYTYLLVDLFLSFLAEKLILITVVPCF